MCGTRRRFLSASLAGAMVGLASLPDPACAVGNWNQGETVVLPPLTLLDGTALDLAAMRGKLVVLEFWASWCPFCAKQNPLIEALYVEHRARGLHVVGVSIDKTRKAADDYVRRHRYSFKAGMVNPAYAAIYHLRKGLPQTYVIGRDGRLAQFDMGEMFEEDIRAIARHL